MRRRESCWKLWVISGLLLFTLPLGASAQRKDTAQAHLDAARRLYEELEYEHALEELDRAQRRARTQDETASILLHEGVILAEMGRPEEASAAFQAALRMRPEAPLPLVVSPKIKRQFEAARQEALRDLAEATAQSPKVARVEPAPPRPQRVSEPKQGTAASASPAPATAPPAPAAPAPGSPAASLPAAPGKPSSQLRSSIDRHALLKRLSDDEAQLRQKDDPALMGPALARLREIHQQIVRAATPEQRMNAAVKLDRWENRFLPPPEESAPELSADAAPAARAKPAPQPPSSIDRDALLKRLSEDEATLRQKNNGTIPGPAMAQLREIRQQLARAVTAEHRLNVAVSLDRWERRFLSPP